MEETLGLRFAHLTETQGLADNQVWAALKDRNGFMWFGTPAGISSYDGYSFKNYSRFEGENDTISGVMVVDMLEDEEGYIWLASLGDGVIRFDQKNQSFKIFRNNAGDALNVAGNAINCLYMDAQNNLWMGTYSTGLLKFDVDRSQFLAFNLSENPIKASEAFKLNSIHAIEPEYGNQHIFWLGANNGLYRFDSNTGTMEHYPSPAPNSAGMSCHALYAEEKGFMWVGTYSGGLVKFNTETKTWRYIPPDDKAWNKRITSTNIVLDIQPKSEKELWICTQDQGLLIFDKNSLSFSAVPTREYDPFALPEKSIRELYIDPENRMWVLSKNKGISLAIPDPDIFSFKAVKSSFLAKDHSNYINDFAWAPGRNQLFLASEGCEGLFVFDEHGQQQSNMLPTAFAGIEQEFYTLAVDSRGWVWLGGRDYVWDNSQMSKQAPLWVLKPNSNLFEPFTHLDLDGIPTQSFDVMDILEDQGGNIWLGTKKGGLIRIDLKQAQVHQYVRSAKHPERINPDNTIWELMEDVNGQLWLATESKGAIRFDPQTEQFFPYPLDPTGKKGLIDSQLTSIAEDGDGNIWIGTKSSGIQIIDPRKPQKAPLKWLSPEDGLPNKRVVKIQKDSRNDMWISTESGLARYQYDNQSFISFSTADGLNSINFMSLGLGYTSNDHLYIGQQHGFYYLNPAQLYRPKKLPPIALTDFKVSENSQRFDRHINFMERIVLDYAENFFSLEFALLDYLPTQKKQYVYKLEGYDADWVYPSNYRNTASYTNVQEGTYTFFTRAIDPYNPDVQTEHTLRIEVNPPWFRSWIAYGFYALAAILLLGGFYRFQLHRQLALQETQRLKELDVIKTKLYTNITHEFRTPLTVIMGMNKQIKGNEEEKKIIHRNSQQLLNLVNQMLDLRKLESGNMPLNWVKGDIIQYLRYIQESFHSFAEVRDIRLHFLANPESFEMDYDEEKLRNIISNLLTNAIKYSTAGGDVYLMLEGGKLPEANSSDLKSPSGEVLKIAVRDKGIGIADDKLPHIFDRFYQVDDRLVRAEEGTGIGLALTRELVKLLAGTISVKSTLGKGSEFTVLLPVSRAATQATSSGELAVDSNLISIAKGSTGSLSPSPVKSSNNQPIILVVEDNLDVAHYIRTTLEAHYDMRFAQNGQEGIDQARELIPDLIISDVMMPIKDGFEVCDTLKNDPKTSHIPLILLTAKADVSSKLAGLRRGADAYLAKPFNETELLIRMEKLLESRDKLRKYYFSLATNKELTFEENAEEELENIFVQQVREIIEAHLTETQFSVQDLSKKMGMSHSQLHRKITALTGKSISNLIRSIRLNKAKELLKDHRLTIASIAYDCGFNDPDYFHRVFKKNFNMTPGEFRNLGES